MDLKKYFTEQEGVGVLSTANSKGKVNSAIFARPNIDEQGNIIFVVAKHRSLENLQENPSASYLFSENGPGYQGVRLDLKLTSIVTDNEKIDQFRKENSGKLYERYKNVDSVLAMFAVEQKRPLIGSGK